MFIVQEEANFATKLYLVFTLHRCYIPHCARAIISASVDEHDDFLWRPTVQCRCTIFRATSDEELEGNLGGEIMQRRGKGRFEKFRCCAATIL